jgi:two-component system LytT family response regulator
MKAIIVDDSPKARTLLRLMMETYAKDFQVLAEAENGFIAFEQIQNLKPEVLFLDIEMPGMSGLQLVEKLEEIAFKGKVVFITAYNEFALKAFRLSAVDYLLKPLQESEFIEAIEKLRTFKTLNDSLTKISTLKTNLTEDLPKKIAIPIVGGMTFIDFDQIISIEADGSYSKLNLKDQAPLLVAKNLSYFEKNLQDGVHFLRTHRSYIVQLKHILKYQKGTGVLNLTNGIMANVSREKKPQIEAVLKQLQT